MVELAATIFVIGVSIFIGYCVLMGCLFCFAFLMSIFEYDEPESKIPPMRLRQDVEDTSTWEYQWTQAVIADQHYLASQAAVVHSMPHVQA